MTLIDFNEIEAITFDCYGTLIDWESGAISAVRPLLSRQGVVLSDDEIVTAFHELGEGHIDKPYVLYREALADLVRGLAGRFNLSISPSETHTLALSIGNWAAFPDTVDALCEFEKRFKIAIISNIDDDLFARTAPHLAVQFNAIVTAEQAQCYKPAPEIFELAVQRLGVTPSCILHVAEGPTEIPPARRLGMRTVWVRRYGRSAKWLTESPDLEVPDLSSLVSLMNISQTGGAG